MTQYSDYNLPIATETYTSKTMTLPDKIVKYLQSRLTTTFVSRVFFVLKRMLNAGVWFAEDEEEGVRRIWWKGSHYNLQTDKSTLHV